MEEKNFGTNATSERKFPSAGKVFGVYILCGICTLLSTFSFLFLILGGVLTAWVISVSKRPGFALAVPVFAVAFLWFFSKDVWLSAISGIFPFLIGLLGAFATRKKLSYWGGSVLCAAGFGLYSGASFVYMLYNWSLEKETGDIVSTAILWWQETTSAAVEIFTKTMESAQLDMALTKDTADALVSGTAALLPGSLSAVFVFLGALMYLLCTVAHKALGTEECFFARKIDPTVGFHGAIFFVVTVVLSVIASFFKNSEAVQFAFLNIATAMFLPLLVTGIAIIVFKIKVARSITAVMTPDGKTHPAPKGTFILWIIIPLTVFSPFMGLTFIALYGAVERINREIFLLSKKRFDEGKGN